MPEPSHTVYTVSANTALNKGLQLHSDTNVGGCLWHHFVSNWGMDTIMCSMPKVHLAWIDLPQEIPSPVLNFWQALTNMVTAARNSNIPVVITAKHSRSQNGSWRLQTFRKWKSLFNFQHARHCFCAYGLRLNGRPFHWKMNSLSLGISIPNTICSEWTDLDTALTAKDAQRLFSLERYFYSIAFQRWVKESHSKFATDSASPALRDESTEAQNEPESDGNNFSSSDNFTPADNHVSKDKQVAYPTEARERQKAREKRAKETGVTLNVQKRKKHVENHFDDCGEDISSIVKNIDTYHATAINHDELSESSDEDDYSYLSYMMWGSNMLHSVKISPNILQASNMEEAVCLLQAIGPGIDIAELCGGVARATTLAVRRSLRAGPNFDLITGVDLNNRKDQELTKSYIDKHHVLVVVMAPTCGPFGPMGRFVKHVTPDAWQRSYDLAAPHGKFCGVIAQMQLRKGLHFICEQPSGSDLYYENPWPDVLKHPRVSQQKYDRCMAGLKAQFGPHKGTHIKKASTMTSSSEILLEPFKDLQCRSNHAHLQMHGEGRNLSACQVWTWDEANRVAFGIHRLKKVEKAYPTISVQANPGQIDERPLRGRDPTARPVSETKCLGCRHRRARTDPDHSRIIGECGFPYDEPVTWKCVGCQQRKNKNDDAHTHIPGECRMTIAQERKSAPRRGHEPRDPRRKATEDATAHLHPADLPDPEGQPLSGGMSSTSRGPDTVPRTRRTFQDGQVGPPNPSDWVSFDVGNTLRALRNNGPTVQRKLIRKLHIRWWHASAQAMTRLLERAGVPKETLEIIPDIVDTCAACRTWSQPLPQSVASVNIPDRFNDQVECDIVFIHSFAILHFVDRCTRWHAAVIVPDKTEESIIKALHSTWISIHGPMKELIMDGESGVAASALAGSFLSRLGIKYIPRAPQQHARIVERRGALLRDVIHRIDAQLKIEGLLDIPFEYRLAEAVFAGNALVTVNNTTPYNAVYGRVPSLLPNMNQTNGNGELTDPESMPLPGVLRNSHRLREIAIQQMIEGTARARLGRALRTKSLAPGEAENYQINEEVDYYRPPTNKDTPGWTGPARITDLTQIQRGTIGINHQGKSITCRLGAVRRHLSFLCLESAMLSTIDHSLGIIPTVKSLVERLIDGSSMHLGLVKVTKPDGSTYWQNTTVTNHRGNDFAKFQQFAIQCLNIDDCIAIRIAKGIGSLPALSGYSASLLLWWHPREPGKISTYEYDCSESLSLRHYLPEKWNETRILQVLRSTEHNSITRPLETPERTVDNVEPEQQNQGINHDHHGRVDGTNNDIPATSSPSDSGLLTPIPEESTQPSTSEFDETDQFFTHEEPDLRHAVHAAYLACLEESELPAKSESSDLGENVPTGKHLPIMEELPADFKTIVQNYHVTAANVRAGLDPNHGINEEPEYVEVFYQGDSAKLVYNRPCAPKKGEILVQRLYLTGARRAVVQRDDDTLTPEELKLYAREVAASMLSELKTWARLKCFSRRNRAKARNIIDCRWVIKWKHEVAVVSVADASKQSGASTTSKRVIRCRLTVRGFKDRDAQNLDSYAGTSQRYSQRLVCSEAAHRGWPICTTDISKAFLQGVTYEELSSLTGEPIREVNFYLPGNCVSILKQVPGFEDFDEHTEVLHCDKPGTGLVDAPRAFSLKLSQVTKNKCRMIPSSVDGELVLKFEPSNNGIGTLVCLMAKHVDDLKLTGKKKVIEWVLQQIQEVFGELKIEWYSFTNCGLRHIQDPTTFLITLDQEEYIKNMKPIIHQDIKGLSSDTECSVEIIQLFMSLLGAVAYALMTRIDVAVFVCAMQRVTHKPKIIHVKRLNAVLRWMQANPKRLTFRPATGPSHLRCVGDAAFKKEEEAGHSLRGALFLRSFSDTNHGISSLKTANYLTDKQAIVNHSNPSIFTQSCVIHIVDAICKAQRHVTRSTFSSELLSASDTVDHGMLLALSLHEFTAGAQSAAQAKTLRETGGWNVKLSLYVDAMSVYAAVTATFIKIPAEKSLLSHIQYIRELLDTKVLEALVWLDTRDMVADGLTKGSVDRDALHSCMNGIWLLQHSAQSWATSKQRLPRHYLPDSV